MTKAEENCNQVFEVAEISLSYKRKKRIPDLGEIKSSEAAVKTILRFYKDIEIRESFWIICMCRNNTPVNVFQLSQGGICGTVADPKLVFMIALKSLATSIILIHNHPSGNLKPSLADIELTDKMIKAGKLLELVVLDHIILTPENGYFSFGDNDLM